MHGNGDIFIGQVREAWALDTGVLTMPSYREPQIKSSVANELPWDDFKRKIEPIGIVRPDGQLLEYLIAEKNIGWGVEDVAIFIGADGREVSEIDDLTPEEGESFLETNFSIAEQLVARDNCESSQVTIGFNSQDFSVGHHSVLKLHSHVRATPHPFDMSRRENLRWSKLNRFDKMSFVEPFAPLYHDYIQRAVELGAFESLIIGAPERRPGFTSIQLARMTNLPLFDNLKAVYSGMKAEYNVIVDIFSDMSVDPTTGRYIPRLKEERMSRLEEFLATRNGFYSAESTQALTYLARNIQRAMPRSPNDPFDMSSSGMIYASRGFAGAITFGFERSNDTMRLEFFPRVITTSGCAKTMMGRDLPTVIHKTSEPASSEEMQITRDYHKDVLGALKGNAIRGPINNELLNKESYAHTAVCTDI
jgi:hypothetical protein